MRALIRTSLVLLSLAGQPARSQTAGRELVTVEVVQGEKTRFPHTLRAPVVRGERKFSNDQAGVAGWDFAEGCPKDIGCGGLIVASADYVGDDASRVPVALRYDDRKRCNQVKEFTVARGRSPS